MSNTSYKNKICVALDFSTKEEAEKWIFLLKDHVGTFKVGLELFCSVGPSIIETVKKTNAKCFLDLKLHDIPNTVKKTVKNCLKYDVDYLTIHASGGFEMLKEAEEEVKNTKMKLLAVTLLTSLNEKDLNSFGIKNLSVSQIVENYGKIVTHAKIDGFVCSVNDVAIIKKIQKDSFCATPGIRFVSNSLDDQKRTDTIKTAIENGSDLLVIGRVITTSNNPVQLIQENFNNIKE